MYKKKIKSIFSWVLPIMIGLIVAVLVRQFIFSVVRVSGSSMYPNLYSNERILLLKQKKIKRFSVVVFNAYNVAPGQEKNTEFVKRVIAVPGDTLKYTANGKLYINGKLYSQSFISQKQRESGTVDAVKGSFSLVSDAQRMGWRRSKKVPKNCYFVMGDNRKVSYDSRYWGFVPKSKIEGVVRVPFWHSKKKIVNEY
ncbi:signal peptidase I (plasmid) [Pediococcus inopinatus]|uniref:Signal peptidase I n=1 Tax=Pediococcus inopinatus TaxID=114090 RepID=A0ABZ0Q7P5_9LACO|nr:signal peptidase I [Pediococcus inopinatus]WPC18614.1 signal peptidase I [Pediococcus inopinatus]WPC22739.1 signal peptidase I [Pediococcus inopinatus]